MKNRSAGPSLAFDYNTFSLDKCPVEKNSIKSLTTILFIYSTLCEYARIIVEFDPEIRQLIGPTQIAYGGFLHAPQAERCNRLVQNCNDRQRPHLPITFTQFGYNSDFILSSCTIGQSEISFESRFILNGVCVILRGNLNRETLCGTSTLHYDEENAELEERRRRELMESYGDRILAIQRKLNRQSEC